MFGILLNPLVVHSCWTVIAVEVSLIYAMRCWGNTWATAASLGADLGGLGFLALIWEALCRWHHFKCCVGECLEILSSYQWWLVVGENWERPGNLAERKGTSQVVMTKPHWYVYAKTTLAVWPGGNILGCSLSPGFNPLTMHFFFSTNNIKGESLRLYEKCLGSL